MYTKRCVGIQKFGFINGVDNVNWPPKTEILKADVSSVSPSSGTLGEEVFAFCAVFISRCLSILYSVKSVNVVLDGFEMVLKSEP